MRAVLGLLFLMGGFTVAYVVLSGQIPTLGTTSTSPTSTSATLPTAQNLQQTQAQMIAKNQGAGGPMGIQLGTQGNDVTGTKGGFY